MYYGSLQIAGGANPARGIEPMETNGSITCGTYTRDTCIRVVPRASGITYRVPPIVLLQLQRNDDDLI